MASDVGTIGLTHEEADRLRLYLLKGGFLWVDDFWGPLAWEQWTHEFSKVLPPEQFPIEDVPLDDPIFQSQFIVEKVPQITNIQFWRARAGRRRPSAGPTAPCRTSARYATSRSHHGRDDPQHGHRRLVGAGGRGSGVLLPVLA